MFERWFDDNNSTHAVGLLFENNETVNYILETAPFVFDVFIYDKIENISYSYRDYVGIILDDDTVMFNGFIMKRKVIE